ncbi:MAG: hypothetical protein ACXVAU_17155, partial [Mucilaginibacter sp.]
MKWIILTILSLGYACSGAQTINKQYVDDWAAKFNPKTKGLPTIDYFIDGEHHFLDDPKKAAAGLLKLDSILKKLSYKDVRSIFGLRVRDTAYETEYPEKVIIIIERRSEQTGIEKSDLLKEAFAKFEKSTFDTSHVKRDTLAPVLSINDKIISHDSCYKELLKLDQK